jgi:maleate isomerase
LGVIAFACTAGSFIGGKGYDQGIVDRIIAATGVPAITMVTSVVDGLRILGIQKLVMLTPYKERMTRLEKKFLEDEGFEVLDYQCLGLDDITEQNRIEPERWYRMALDMQNPEADGYLLSCGGMRVVSVIERLETELRKPVITSNQATLWRCLRITGYQKPVKGFGRLMMTP